MGIRSNISDWKTNVASVVVLLITLVLTYYTPDLLNDLDSKKQWYTLIGGVLLSVILFIMPDDLKSIIKKRTQK